WDVAQLELGGHAHFMLKAIMEQPDSVRATLRGRLLPDAGSARLNGLNLTPEDCAAIQRVVIVACGTSWHAGLVGRDLIEELAGIPVQVEYASEYRYRRPVVGPGAGARPHGGAGSGAGVPADPAAAAGDAHPGARARGPGAGRAFRRRAQFPVSGTRREFPGRSRGRLEAQGDLLHPRRGVPGGRDE